MIADNIRQRKNISLFIAMIIISGLLLMSCGIGGSGVGGSGNSGNVDDGYDGYDGSGSTITRSVTLNWNAASQNTDGSNLTDLAGYKVYYGISSGNYTQSVDIGNFTGAVINDLTPGTWCFAVTAYDTSGNESNFSIELCTTLK